MPIELSIYRNDQTVELTIEEKVYVVEFNITAGSATPDLSNYLAKDNTTSYTPSSDYNPATKKYVDDNASSSGVSTDADNSLSLGTDNKPYFKERTAAEIATAYESNADTNKFTDADKSAVGSAVQPGNLAMVATSGSYDDLLDKPTIPGVPDEEDILGSVETAGSVTGTKNLDLAAYSAFRYTLTGATTLTESGTPVSGRSFVRNLLITGDFALTYPASWTRKIGTYSGSKMNLITISYINSSGNLNVDVMISQTN